MNSEKICLRLENGNGTHKYMILILGIYQDFSVGFIHLIALLLNLFSSILY